jgi:hypothetical protein
VLLKPKVDASDGEMHFKNGFSHVATHFKDVIDVGVKDLEGSHNCFRPLQLGEFSKTNQGARVHTKLNRNTPDFKRKSYGEVTEQGH